MKKLLLLLTLFTIAFAGCSKEEKEEKDTEKIYVSVSTYTAMDYSQYPDKRFVNSVIEIYDITNGIGIKKKISDIDGTAKNLNGENVKAISMEINEPYLHSSLDANKTYYIFVKVVGKDYGNTCAHSDTVITATNKSIELEKIFSAGARANNYEKWNVDFTEKQTDFNVATFGDTKEYVKAKESAPFISSTSDKLIYSELGGGQTRIEREYHFTENIFTKGLTNCTCIIRSSGSGGDLTGDAGTGMCFSLYKTYINDLIKKYGTPDYVSEDIFILYDGTGEGSILQAGMDVMNGRKSYSYKFSNDDVNIECTLQRANRRVLPGVWGFTIEHILTEKSN